MVIITGRMYGTTVRSIAQSHSPAFFGICGNRYAVTEEWGILIFRYWIRDHLLGVLWSGNLFGGLAQGRKPHGGSENS